MKRILIHVKDNETIDKYSNYLSYGYANFKYSHEVTEEIIDFTKNGWHVYLTSIDNYDKETQTYKRIYSVSDRQSYTFDKDSINELIDVMIIRVIGSVEGNFDNIRSYLQSVNSFYKGVVINNPKAMLKGMTKHYLNDLDESKLEEIGIKKIPTDIYPPTVTRAEMEAKYGDLTKYIIKPVSGELSNSLKCLDDMYDDNYRYKESLVKGWVVQPIMEEVWNGEYQMLFVDKELAYSQSKEYIQDGTIPNQKKRILHKYKPSIKEINMGNALINYVEELYNISSPIVRIDFFKDSNNTPILLEFEMVNPGFFIGYMAEHDNDIHRIVSFVRRYCDRSIRSK